MNPEGISLFQQQLSRILQVAKLTPTSERTVVLLDVSSSMGDSYQDGCVQRFLHVLLAMTWVRILRFNDGLLEGGDLRATEERVVTSGGTQLGRALCEIESRFGLPDKLLIVTDGEHDKPRGILSRVPDVRECLRKEIGDNIAWLR